MGLELSGRLGLAALSRFYYYIYQLVAMATVAVDNPWDPLKWDALKSQLEKKLTFEQGVQGCVEALAQVQGSQAVQEPLTTLLARCMKLLKTRYSSRTFWHAGRTLFLAAEKTAATPALKATIATYLADCNDYLRDDEEEAGPSSAGERGDAPQQQHRGAAPVLFEGQLSSEATMPARPQGHHEGLMDLLSLAMSQQMAQAGAHASQQEGNSTQHAQQVGGEMDAQRMEQLAAAMQQELDAIAVRIMEESGQEVPRGPPPASKKVVRSLPVEDLTPALISELGGPPLSCPVCM